MAKIKIWKRTDGGVSITYFNFLDKKQSETEEEFIERKSEGLRLNSLLVGAEELIADSSDLTESREFRNDWAWDSASKKVKADQAKVAARKKKEKDEKDKVDRVKNKLKELGISDSDLDAVMNRQEVL